MSIYKICIPTLKNICQNYNKNMSQNPHFVHNYKWSCA